MEARELYKQKYSAQIDEWGAKLDVVKAKFEQMGAQAKLDAKPGMDNVHSKFDAAKKKLDAIAEATDETWDQVVKEIDTAWEDFKASAEGAYDAIKDHKDNKKN